MGLFDYVRILLRINRLYDRDRAERIKAGTLSEDEAELTPEEAAAVEPLSPRLLKYILGVAEAADESAIDTPARVERTVGQLQAVQSLVGRSEEDDERLKMLLFEIRNTTTERPTILPRMRERLLPELARLLTSARIDEPLSEAATRNVVIILQALSTFDSIEATREMVRVARLGLCSDSGMWDDVVGRLEDYPQLFRLYLTELDGAPLQGHIQSTHAFYRAKLESE